ncbi:MAG TPA: CDP-archaeol synthase [Chitinophagales bacterium]|jgi:phosphatidate cytidylyltransferase|nr:CDP-archaeol synthase [Chitinophagales bacterium]
MGDIWTRIVTGIFFLIVMIGGVVINEYSFLILFSLLVVLCINEYHGIIHNLLSATAKWKTTYKAINTFFSVIIFGIVFLVASGKIPLISLSLLCGFPLTWLVIEMYTKSEKPFYNVCLNSMAIFYLAIPLSASCLLAFNAGEYSWHYLLAIMMFAWSNDSFAYLFGRFFGKHKLFERISPKKTWEGFFGGVAGSVLFAYILSILFPLWTGYNVSFTTYAILAVITAISSTYGDLAESMIKRNLQIKDTGTVLPGHGGFLDRFDGLIFSLPACTLYLTFFQG